MNLRKLKRNIKRAVIDLYTFESGYYESNKGVVTADYLSLLRQRRSITVPVMTGALLASLASKGTGWDKIGRFTAYTTVAQLAIFADCYLEAARVDGSPFEKVGNIFLQDLDDVEVTFDIENPYDTIPWITDCITCKMHKQLWYARGSETFALKLAREHHYITHAVILNSNEESEEITQEEIDAAVDEAINRLEAADRSSYEQQVSFDPDDKLGLPFDTECFRCMGILQDLQVDIDRWPIHKIAQHFMGTHHIRLMVEPKDLTGLGWPNMDKLPDSTNI